MKETHAPTILSRKTGKPRSNGREACGKEADQTAWTTVRAAITRPCKMLICSPTILIVSLHMFVVYGYFYLLFTTIPLFFQDIYAFSSGSIGLAFLGSGTGTTIGVVVSGLVSYKWAERLRDRADTDEYRPEYRLPLAIIGSIILPIDLLWVGWTAESHQHWILPIIGAGIISVTTSFIYVS